MRTGHLRRRMHSLSCLLVSQIPHAITGIEETYGEVAEAEAEVAEATSSTSPEVGADAGAGRGRPRPRFHFSFFWHLDGIWVIYRLPQIPSGQPVAPVAESLIGLPRIPSGQPGCPDSRVL